MLDTDPNTIHRGVRDGRLAAVTCYVCGCRLEAEDETTAGGGPDAGGWFHFGRIGGRDARGCRVECVDLPHDSRGMAALAA